MENRPLIHAFHDSMLGKYSKQSIQGILYHKLKEKRYGTPVDKNDFLILRKMWKTCEMLACGKQL